MYMVEWKLETKSNSQSHKFFFLYSNLFLGVSSLGKKFTFNSLIVICFFLLLCGFCGFISLHSYLYYFTCNFSDKRCTSFKQFPVSRRHETRADVFFYFKKTTLPSLSCNYVCCILFYPIYRISIKEDVLTSEWLNRSTSTTIALTTGPRNMKWQAYSF